MQTRNEFIEENLLEYVTDFVSKECESELVEWIMDIVPHEKLTEEMEIYFEADDSLWNTAVANTKHEEALKHDYS